MTKTEFTWHLAKKFGITLPYAEKILNAVLDSIEDALFKDGKATLRGFGVFEVVVKAARKGRNPSTGEVICIQSKRHVRFRPGVKLRDYLD